MRLAQMVQSASEVSEGRHGVVGRPGIPAETVAAAVRAVTPRAGQRRQVAWALGDRPELLTGTGAGAEAGVPSVLRLIDHLCEAGARPPPEELRITLL